MKKDCPLRPQASKEEIAMQDKPADAGVELPGDDQEVILFDMQQPDDSQAPAEEDEPPAAALEEGPRDWIVDLWPFSRPIAFYEGIITDVLKMEGILSSNRRN